MQSTFDNVKLLDSSTAILPAYLEAFKEAISPDSAGFGFIIKVLCLCFATSFDQVRAISMLSHVLRPRTLLVTPLFMMNIHPHYDGGNSAGTSYTYPYNTSLKV